MPDPIPVGCQTTIYRHKKRLDGSPVAGHTICARPVVYKFTPRDGQKCAVYLCEHCGKTAAQKYEGTLTLAK